MDYTDEQMKNYGDYLERLKNEHANDTSTDKSQYEPVSDEDQAPIAQEMPKKEESAPVATTQAVEDTAKNTKDESDDEDYQPDTENTANAQEDTQANKSASKNEEPAEEPKSEESSESGMAPKEATVEQQNAQQAAQVPQIANPVMQALSKIMPNQGNRDLRQLQMQTGTNQFLKGLALVGHGLAHAPGTPDLSHIDKNIQQDQQMYMLKQESQKQDPGSDYSKSFREFTSQLIGKPIADNVSAAQLEKVMPYATLQVKNDLATKRLLAGVEAKGQTASDLEEQKQGGRVELAGQKGDTQKEIADKRITAQAGTQASSNEKSLDTALGQVKSKRGAVGDLQAAKNAVIKLKALVKQYGGDYDKVPRAQVAEIVSQFNQIGGAGSNTDEKFKKLMPDTAVGSAAGMASWITNEAEPAQYGNFIKLFMNSAEDQAKAAQAGINDELISTAKLKEGQPGLTPERIKSKLKSAYGIDGSDYEKWKPGAGVSATQGASQGPNEEVRLDPKSGNKAVFDSKTKKFLRWEKAQ